MAHLSRRHGFPWDSTPDFRVSWVYYSTKMAGCQAGFEKCLGILRGDMGHGGHAGPPLRKTITLVGGGTFDAPKYHLFHRYCGRLIASPADAPSCHPERRAKPVVEIAKRSMRCAASGSARGLDVIGAGSRLRFARRRFAVRLRARSVHSAQDDTHRFTDIAGG